MHPVRPRPPGGERHMSKSASALCQGTFAAKARTRSPEKPIWGLFFLAQDQAGTDLSPPVLCVGKIQRDAQPTGNGSSQTPHGHKKPQNAKTKATKPRRHATKPFAPTSKYALTGAIFARDRKALMQVCPPRSRRGCLQPEGPSSPHLAGSLHHFFSPASRFQLGPPGPLK